MKINDLERALRDAKFHHLTDDVLVSYRDQQLDAISRTQAQLHLDLCLICERRLLLLQKEQAALETYKASAEEIALAKSVLQQISPPVPPPVKIPLRNRLAAYGQQVAASWQAYTLQLERVRNSISVDVEFWRWQSEDGQLLVYAVMESTGDLKLYFSSNDPTLEGTRLTVKAGGLSRETTMERVSESELRAEIDLPRRQRPRNLANILIEIG